MGRTNAGDVAFWNGYVEPVVDIVVVANHLQLFARRLAGKDDDSREPFGIVDNWRDALGQINNVAQLHRNFAAERNGSIKLVTTADSLYALLASAMMHADEIGYQFSVCRTEGCGLAFVAERSDKLSCSDRCRKKHDRRKQRAS